MSSCGPFRRRTVSPFIFTFVVSRPAVRKNLWLRLLAVGSRLKASRAPALGPVLPRPVTLVESGGEREGEAGGIGFADRYGGIFVLGDVCEWGFLCHAAGGIPVLTQFSGALWGNESTLPRR